MKHLQKFIKEHWLTLVIIVIVFATAGVIVSTKTQQKYAENPELIPVRKNYNMKVELAPEQEMEYETLIIESDKKINDFFDLSGQNST
jgi:hypothetical protein